MNEYLQEISQQQPSVDYKAIFFKILRYWYLFVLTILLSLVVAYLVNKYTRPVYEVRSSLLIKERSDNNLNPQEFIGFGFNNFQNLQNEIGIMTSYELAFRTITKAGFEVSYFKDENFISHELYKDAPFTVVLDTTAPQPYNLRFDLTILSKEQYRLDVKEENVNYYDYSKREVIENPDKKTSINYSHVLPFGSEINNGDFKFKVVLNSKFNVSTDINQAFYFVLRDYDGLVTEFRSFKVEPINKEASIVEIKLRGMNVEKLVDFINSFAEEYISKGLERKNMVSRRTIDFIDNELKGIADTLYASEKALQVFRTSKEIMNLDDEAKQVFDKMIELQDDKAKLMVQEKYLTNLKEYLEKNQGLDKLIVPSSMGVEDPLLNALTTNLTTLYTNRTELEQYSKENNPALKSLDNQIATTKNVLYENIKSAINTNQISQRDINNRIDVISQRMNRLPETQRVLIGIERKFKLTDAIYTYLLQKRSEAQITQASNLADNEIVDKARVEGSLSPVAPKKSLNYIVALIIGLVLPLIYILGREYLNDKIVEREDVEKITHLPIMGHIIHSDYDSKIVVQDYPKSSIAESFRSVRTNLQYLLQGKEKQVILLTSDMVSTGKTFCAVNLACIFAMYGKKTLLMGFDLRKPKIYQEFGLSNSRGISSYLIRRSTLDETIQKSSIENLDIIMAGPVPPNPSELIASEQTTEMFNELKKRYDFIIIDTPPIGLVTDAFLLMKHTDANLILARQNFTYKKIFGSIVKDLEQRNLPRLAILINDVKLTKSTYGYGFGYGYGYGYGYGHGYGYGYGYGYYSEDRQADKKSVLKRILGKT